MGFPGLPTNHVWNFLGQWGWANVDWCEATVMGYVTEPANTWSNVAYLMVGTYILINQKKETHPLLRLMPIAIIALAFLSGFYHATNAWVTQFGDFLGMFMVASIPLLMNLEKLGLKKAGTLSGYIFLVTVSCGVTILGRMLSLPIQSLIVIFFAGIIVTELLLAKESPLASYKNLFMSLGFFATAISFSALDVSRTICDPHNHVIQGHALWHGFSAVGVYFAYAYAKQAQGRHQGYKSSQESLS